MNDPSVGPGPARATQLHDLPEIANDGLRWRPLRRHFGITGFGAAVFSATAAGDELIEPHDETSPGAGVHEELYVVVAGHARFTIGDEERDAPAGTFVFVPPGVHRAAVATAPDSHVLVVGGARGAALPVSPFEYWYAALGPLAAGDPAGAADVAAAGFADHPDHGQLHYQVACFASLAGQRERALHHLRRAVAGEPRAWRWLVDDPDLDALRDEPGFPRRADVAGLAVEEAGAGLAVVLVHAGVADRRMWDREWAEWPARGLRVVRFDQRGFGDSPLADGPVAHGADLLRVLDGLGIARAVLVGASLGGAVALEVAVAAPERVAGLVLIDAPLDDHAWSEEVEAFAEAEEEALEDGDVDEATEVNVRFWLTRRGAHPAPPDAAVAERVRAMQRRAFELQIAGDGASEDLVEGLSARLGEVRAPTLVLAGAGDVPDFLELAGVIAAGVPGARLELVEHAAHLPSLEQPQAFEAVVGPFLDGIA